MSIDVNSIGRGKASFKKQQANKLYRDMLAALGVLPTKYDDTVSINKNNTQSGERYSTMYATEQEFRDDQTRALRLFSNGKSIPADLYTKVTETVKEKNIRA